METSKEIAHHLKSVFFGGNWTAVNVKEVLNDVDYQMATKQIGTTHSISILLYHIGYFTTAIQGVLENNVLNAKDRFSFDGPPLPNELSWQNLIESTLNSAESLADKISQFPSHRLGETFVDAKYGSYHRNFLGLIEHTHYHLGQIVLIKKLLSMLS